MDTGGNVAPLISVIVPVYRVEPYLSRCVESILSQTYRNLEIILVDDGSPDRCGEICDRYAEQDHRVRVVHQENRGLSAARNAGIARSRGEYLALVDSDDWIDPTMYEKLYAALKNSGADMALCDIFPMGENGDALPLFPFTSLPHYPSRQSAVISGMDALRRLFCEYDVRLVVAWNKLYRRALFKDFRFPVDKIHEDDYLAPELLLRCGSIAAISHALYNYCIRNGSIMRSLTPLDRLAVAKIRCAYCAFLEEHALTKWKGNVLLPLSRQYAAAKILQPRQKPAEERKREREIDEIVRKTYRANRDLCDRRTRLAFCAPRLFSFLQRRWNHLRAIDQRLRRLAVWLYTAVRQRRCDAILLGTPEHDNIGDHAIAIAERQILADALPRCRVMECGGSAFRALLDAGSLRLPQLSGTRRRVFFYHGGGNLGILWPEEEEKFRKLLKALSRQTVVVFPQSVYFDLSTPWGRAFFEESRRIYSAHPDLTIFLREAESFRFMRTHMPDVRVVLVPDVVTALRPLRAAFPRTGREGILFCLRRDLERTLSDRETEVLLTAIKKRYPAERITVTDMLHPSNIPLRRREDIVWKKLEQFSQFRLIVTDRMHAMLFAALTSSPCIALGSLSKKTGGVYAWIRENAYIRFCASVESFPAVLEEMDCGRAYAYRSQQAKTAMEPLYRLLRDLGEDLRR